MTQLGSYALPMKPYTAVDAINRRAAATGSVRYAQLAADADYNGHHVSLHWNDYRGYYVLEYHWGERVVIWRGKDYAEGLRQAKQEFARQGRGAFLVTGPHTPEDEAIVKADPDFLTAEQAEAKASEWHTWQHNEISAAMTWQDMAGVPINLFLDAATKDAWDVARNAFLEARKAGGPR